MVRPRTPKYGNHPLNILLKQRTALKNKLHGLSAKGIKKGIVVTSVRREIYQRIIAKGKPKKLALIAVANKLLKQSLAIAKSGLYYDENFRSVNLNNV